MGKPMEETISEDVDEADQWDHHWNSSWCRIGHSTLYGWKDRSASDTL
jgi:hypothetical protein